MTRAVFGLALFFTAAAETAIFSCGCFWQAKDSFELAGVSSVTVGYIGGWNSNPTQVDVLKGTTGHAEAVLVTYNSSEINYRDLVNVFFRAHDASSLGAQGLDIGMQYRSALWPVNAKQNEIAHFMIGQLSAEDHVVRTTVSQPGEHTFYPAAADIKFHCKLATGDRRPRSASRVEAFAPEELEAITLSARQELEARRKQMQRSKTNLSDMKSGSASDRQLAEVDEVPRSEERARFSAEIQLLRGLASAAEGSLGSVGEARRKGAEDQEHEASAKETLTQGTREDERKKAVEAFGEAAAKRESHRSRGVDDGMASAAE